MGVWGCIGISWTVCKQSAPRSRQITTPTPHHSIFTGRMLFLTPSQQHQNTEGTVMRLWWNCTVVVFDVVLYVSEMESAVSALNSRYFAGRTIIARPYHEQSLASWTLLVNSLLSTYCCNRLYCSHTIDMTHHAGWSSLSGDCCLSVECSSIICSFCTIAAAVPPRPQDGTVSVIVLFTIVFSCDTLKLLIL